MIRRHARPLHQPHKYPPLLLILGITEMSRLVWIGYSPFVVFVWFLADYRLIGFQRSWVLNVLGNHGGGEKLQ